MDTGAGWDDVGARAEDDRGVVVLRATRPHARVYGSVVGPSVLAPGIDEDEWQVIRVLSGVDRVAHLARAVRFPPTPEAGLGLVEPVALGLGRTGSTRELVVPTGPTTWTTWTWTREPGQVPRTDGLDAIVSELASMGGGAEPAAVRAALLGEWTERDPLREVVALLGMPVTAVDILEVPDTDAPRLGELLVPTDTQRHSKAMVRALAAPGRPSWSEIAAEVASDQRPVPGDRFFGVTWMVLGTVLLLFGVLRQAQVISTEGTVVGLESPLAWIVLGAVLAWIGHRKWRRGVARRSTA